MEVAVSDWVGIHVCTYIVYVTGRMRNPGVYKQTPGFTTSTTTLTYTFRAFNYVGRTTMEAKAPGWGLLRCDVSSAVGRPQNIARDKTGVSILSTSYFLKYTTIFSESGQHWHGITAFVSRVTGTSKRNCCRHRCTHHQTAVTSRHHVSGNNPTQKQFPQHLQCSPGRP